MNEVDLRQPSEVVRDLNISSSTLRRWSSEFAEFLSHSAGRPEASPQGETLHRRYTHRDVQVLATVGESLRRGMTYRQIASNLKRAEQIAEQSEQYGETAVVPLAPGPDIIVPPAVSSAVSMIGSTLERVIEGQQTVLNSQQANRDLLGVVIQDNFNLKEENARLRDRMLQLERDLSEFRRREDAFRLDVVERMHELESRNHQPAAGEVAQQPDANKGAGEAKAASKNKGCLFGWLSVLSWGF